MGNVKKSVKAFLVSTRLKLFPRHSSREYYYKKYIKPLADDLLKGGFSAARAQFNVLQMRHNQANYLSPMDLAVTTVVPRRILIVGSCLAELWQNKFDCPCDFVLTNHLNELPNKPPRAPEEYDLQLIQIPLRLILSDDALWHLPYTQPEAYQQVFDQTVDRMRLYLEMASKWTRLHNIPTLLANFFVPQQNSMGVLMPRYDLRNPVYFIEQLNMQLVKEMESYPNMHLLDIDGIAAVIGKQHIQDNIVELENHASILGNSHYEKDQERIEFIHPASMHYDLKTDAFFEAMCQKVMSIYRVLKQVDVIKLVIVDLDNTLWRGLPAEEGSVSAHNFEGWPLGFIEALCYLKKRGVVLAIASKNDEGRIREFWPQIMQGRLALEDFAVVRINWQTKIQNVEEILGLVNVLPRNTLFIDDNPVERAAVQAAFPDIRTLGTYPYYFKRILLWSSETQVPSISSESAARTELIQARVDRENMRTKMTREDFLKTLEVAVTVIEIRSTSHANFARVFELLNKTNQFNTVGKRWTKDECADYFAKDGVFYAFSARDKFSDYGIVGCGLVSKGQIDQFIMSCRVIGLDVEDRVLEYISQRVSEAGYTELMAQLIETDANYPCRDMYEKRGFQQTATGWVRALANKEASLKVV